MAGRAASLLFIVVIGHAGSAQWIRIASPHFELYTDTGERGARRVLARFEQARQVLPSAARSNEPPRLPARVLLFGSERDFATVRPGSVASGFYQSGPDRDYIAVLAGAGVDRIVLHEYAHSLLNHATAPLPQWLEEGLAELYSTIAVNGTRASVGGPIPAHVATLRRERWLTGMELSTVDSDSGRYKEAAKVGMFYAQSWALTHMLTFAEAYRGKLWPFIDALAVGGPPTEAFAKAFGKDMDAAVHDLESYARLPFRGIEIYAPAIEEIPFSEAEVLDPAVAQQSRAEMLLLMGRDGDARRIYVEVAKRFPESPAAQTGLAMLAMRNHDIPQARRLFERAIELGANDGSTWFEYAMLLRDAGAAPERVREFLERAIAANPAHAEAHFLLGIRASDADRLDDAVTHLRTATEILPRQAYFWQALSFAYHKLGRAAEARSAALRAMRAGRTEHEIEMARGALRLIEDPAASGRSNRGGVVTPDSWRNAKGDRTVRGQLTHVDCEGAAARLHVRVEDVTTIFHVADSRSVAIRGSEANATLWCGPQRSKSPAWVEVEFFENTKQVTAILFQ